MLSLMEGGNSNISPLGWDYNALTSGEVENSKFTEKTCFYAKEYKQR